MFALVTEFHRAFDLLVAVLPELPPDPAIRDLRVRLLREEFLEYLAGERNDDLIEIADALTDMAYIICGTAVAYGIMPDHTLPSLCDPEQPAPRLCDADIRQMLRRMLCKDFDGYLAAEASNQLDRIKAALFGMLHSIHAAACSYQIPLNAVFAEVHASNMSKLDNSGRPLYRQDGKVLKGENYRKPDIRRVLFPAASHATT